MMDSETHDKRPPMLTSSNQDLSPQITNVGEIKHYFCGCCSSKFNNLAITYPVHKILFRQQLYGIKTTDAILQLRRDGFRNLDRGILPPLMQKSTTLALMFGLYEDLSRLLRKHASTAPGFATRSVAAVHLPTASMNGAHLVNDFICGSVLGAMLGFLSFPINVVKARIQSQASFLRNQIALERHLGVESSHGSEPKFPSCRQEEGNEKVSFPGAKDELMNVVQLVCSWRPGSVFPYVCSFISTRSRAGGRNGEVTGLRAARVRRRERCLRGSGEEGGRP
ncbi:solute carrier family 25 member 51-like isoform X2 [Cricetulus griseus]|uniref:Solute carrier family 25 member 51-like isoform X2 n=1 Tax=Cricetulus griseus TaxID=10029 RepID=A0A9J7EW97_CRIGR|nr:solute carrier family 25 member 51-like isoform X2 [Cricetulus griseus]